MKAVGPADPTRLAERLRARTGIRLAELDPRSTPGFTGTKEEGVAALDVGAGKLSNLQERLFAASKGGDRRSVLLVVQGMDTAGKGGIMRHVVGSVDPQGVHTSPRSRRRPPRSASTTSAGASAKPCPPRG